jgi:hypothetical protein
VADDFEYGYDCDSTLIRRVTVPFRARRALEAGFSFREEVLVGDSAMSLV